MTFWNGLILVKYIKVLSWKYFFVLEKSYPSVMSGVFNILWLGST